MLALSVVACTSRNWAAAVKKPIWPALPFDGAAPVSNVTVLPMTSGTLSLGVTAVIVPKRVPVSTLPAAAAIWPTSTFPAACRMSISPLCSSRQG